jgi:hypothetical protein
MLAPVRIWIAVLVALGLAAPAGGEPYAVGSVLPALSLEDQHGESRTLDASVRVVLFSRDMDGGGVVKQALADDGPDFLERNRAVYVTDVSAMPGLVLRLMARPAMRRRPYPMLLDEQGDATADFPSQKGKATLVFLERSKVVRVAYASTPDALRGTVQPAEPGEGASRPH